MIVYQITNFDREEIIYGHTEIHIEKEVERIAKDPKGPASHWKRGELVQWRPLTDMVSPERAKELHKELEGHVPPNKYRVIPTFKEA